MKKTPKPKLKVNPEELNYEVDRDLVDPVLYRVIPIIVFVVVGFIHFAVESIEGDKYEYVWKEGATQEEYNEFYEKRFLMYTENKINYPKSTAKEDARNIFYTKVKIEKKPMTDSVRNFWLFIFSIMGAVFIYPTVYKFLIYRKMLAQLEYEMGEKERIESEKVDAILSNPTFNPLNIK